MRRGNTKGNMLDTLIRRISKYLPKKPAFLRSRLSFSGMFFLELFGQLLYQNRFGYRANLFVNDFAVFEE